MMYVNEFVPALKLTGADERVLRDQLKLLQAQGEIAMDPTGRVVFLDREYLIRMFKPMCDSRMGNRLWLSRMIAAQDAIRALYGRPLCTEFEKIALGNSAENFEKTGEIHEELIINMWDALGLPVRREDYGQMISMLHLGPHLPRGQGRGRWAAVGRPDASAPSEGGPAQGAVAQLDRRGL